MRLASDKPPTCRGFGPDAPSHVDYRQLGARITSSEQKRHWTGPGRAPTVGGGFAVDEVIMSEYMNMPDDVRAVAEQAYADVRSGAVHPFTGPITDRDGTLQIPEGETATDVQLLTMDYFVEGVIGDLPL